MKTKLFKPFITLFFLLLLSGGKAFGCHVLVHDHDAQITDCIVCDKALVDQFSPLDLSNQSIELLNIQKEFHDVTADNYAFNMNAIEQPTILFSRPPPQLN